MNIGLLFGSWEVPRSMWCGLLPPRDPLRIPGPLPPVRKWWGHPWHWTPVSSCLAAGESGMSRLLGRNRQSAAPRVQDHDKRHVDHMETWLSNVRRRACLTSFLFALSFSFFLSFPLSFFVQTPFILIYSQ
jgi:hypothetical protein